MQTNGTDQVNHCMKKELVSIQMQDSLVLGMLNPKFLTTLDIDRGRFCMTFGC